MTRSRLRQTLILGLTATVGAGLSVLATLFVHRWEASQQQSRFQQQLENLAISLQRSLNRYTDVLTFLDDYYGLNQGSVQRQDFAAFVARSIDEYPGIQALEWAPVVRASDRATFEQTLRDAGFVDFQITELGPDEHLQRAGDRPDYLPVTYVEPLAGNEAALGFDLNSSPARLAAIEPARDSGEIHATGRIRLVQEQRDQFGFLVVLPLYQTPNLPPSTAARRSQFSGILLGVFRVSDVVEEALQGLDYDIDFEMRDQNAPPEEQFLGRYDSRAGVVLAMPDVAPLPSSRLASLCPQPTTCTRQLEIGQRRWVVAFEPATTDTLNTNYTTWATLLTGLLLTGTLVLFLRSLQNELHRTKTLNDLKLRVFSMASHELRTPLSTILLTTESLQLNAADLSAVQHRNHLQRIHLTAQQMSQQITDLLTLTRAEVGKLDFSPELLAITGFCRQIVNEAQVGIAQPIEFVPVASSVKAFWDKKLVRSLLSNLLSNAAKYSPPDSPITVSLSLDHQQATIQVRDRGIGIPIADHPRIQDAFQRGSNVGEISGTGLGLAIVQVCVSLHSGHWSIDSKEGQGTLVSVTLPLE